MAISNAPTLASTALITGAPKSTYTVTRDLINDAAGKSWSIPCGKATVTLDGAPEFITVDTSTGIITMEPTKVSHVGTHYYKIVRKVAGVD